LHSQRVVTADRIVGYESASKTLSRVARILAFVAFTGIGAQLAVRLPFTPVPVTMQTLFVVLAGVTLGPRDGFYAMISYLALGVSGIPVFAGFGYGPAILFGSTGGYLIAFPVAALVSGWIYERSKRNRAALAGGALCGSMLIILSGTLHLSLVSGLSIGQTVPIAATPFIAGEVLKAFLAAFVAGKR